MADLLLVETNKRSLHGEIEKLFAVDRGELLRSELRRHVLDRIRRRRSCVAPAGKRDEHRGSLKLGQKFDRQVVHTVKIGEAGANVNATLIRKFARVASACRTVYATVRPRAARSECGA